MKNKKIGIYVHIPFCKQKCYYCDFVSYCNKDNLIYDYVKAVKKEIRLQNIQSQITTIYIGGGTPSYIDSQYIKEIIEEIKKKNVTKRPEITIEVNPGTVTKEKLRDYKKCGINRLSIGLQSVQDDILKEIGRIHNYKQFLEVYKLAREVGFKNINIDLMLGIPYQTKESVKNFVDFCTENEIKHISAYLLKIEKGTKFYVNRNNLNLPSDDESSEIYEFAVDYLSKKGYHQYEVSNFSIPNFESKHNLKYWNLEEYIGIGPSAHSLFGGQRFYYKNSLKDFAECPQTHREGEFEPEIEYIMLRMRLSEGLNFEKFKKKFGKDIPQKYLNNTRKYVGFGLLISDKSGIRLTKKGFLLSNFVIGGILG